MAGPPEAGFITTDEELDAHNEIIMLDWANKEIEAAMAQLPPAIQSLAVDAAAYHSEVVERMNLPFEEILARTRSFLGRIRKALEELEAPGHMPGALRES